MYFPYLHGMQKEMLALRQMASLLAAEGQVQPVIEPVRYVLASLRHTLQACDHSGLYAWLVMNPVLQEFTGLPAETALRWGRNLLMSIPQRSHLRPTLMLHAGVQPDVVRLFSQFFVGQSVGVVMAEEAAVLIPLLEHLRGVDLVTVFFRGRKPSAEELAAVAPAAGVWVESREVSMPDALRRPGLGGFLQERVFFSDALSRHLETGGPGFSEYTSLPSMPLPGGGATGGFHLAYLQRGGPMDGALCVEFFVAERQYPPERLAETRFKLALQRFNQEVNRPEACFGPTEAVRRFLSCHLRNVPPTQALARQWQLMHHIELVSGLLGGRFPLRSDEPGPR